MRIQSKTWARAPLLSALGAAAALSATYSASAGASGPFETFGVDARQAAMAGTGAANTDVSAAAFYNPARLSAGTESRTNVSGALQLPNLSFEFARAPTGDALQPHLPETTGGLSIGYGAPFSGKLKGFGGWGLAVYVPEANVMKVRLLDPARPHFIAYDGVNDRLDLAMGFSIRPLPVLSFGLGARASGGMVGPMRLAIDPLAGRISQQELDTVFKHQIGPIAGLEIGTLSFGPVKGNLGATFRGAYGTPVNFDTNIGVDGVEAGVQMIIDGVVNYTPNTAVIGTAWTFAETLTASVDVQWVQWSAAPAPSPKVTMDIQGEDAEILGLDEGLDLPADGVERVLDPGFRDVWIPRVGLELALLEGALHLRAGYALRPSHVPDQTTGSNYADGTTHQLAGGLGYSGRDPWQFFDGVWHVDAAVQSHVMPRRATTKVARNDAVGNYTAGGSVTAALFTLGYTFAEPLVQPAAPQTPRSGPGGAPNASAPERAAKRAEATGTTR